MTIAEANIPISTGIRAIISRKGLKNLHVAEKGGYTARELSDMLNGRKLIKACDILKLSRALGVTVDDIFAAGIESEVKE